MPNYRDTRWMLEYVRYIERDNEYNMFVIPFTLEELEQPSTYAGKLNFMQDEGYLRFQTIPIKNRESNDSRTHEIGSISLTPKGEELLKKLTTEGAGGDIKRICLAVFTAITTVLAMKLLGLK